MIRIAIVEDESEFIDTLKQHLQRFFSETGETYRLDTFTNPLPFLNPYSYDYNVVLLDIEMPHMNGLEAAYQVRQMDQDIIIVFITYMAQYAINGYEVNALDYIVKPISYDLFAHKMRRVLHHIELNQGEDYLIIHNKEKVVKIPVSDLLYVEIQNHFLIYHLREDVVTIYGSLKEVEEKLKNCHFSRCNQCYLVNLKHLKRVDGMRVTVGNNSLQISRPRKKQFIEDLTLFLGGMV